MGGWLLYSGFHKAEIRVSAKTVVSFKLWVLSTFIQAVDRIQFFAPEAQRSYFLASCSLRVEAALLV